MGKDVKRKRDDNISVNVTESVENWDFWGVYVIDSSVIDPICSAFFMNFIGLKVNTARCRVIALF